jgi:hypothetical protein
MTVAVNTVPAIPDGVESDGGAATELGVRDSNAGVDDVGVDACAG